MGSMVVILFVTLVGLLHQAGDLADLLDLATLEFILPLTLGLVAAGLLAGDPVIELLLTNQQPAWKVLLERVIYLFLVGAVLATILLVLSSRWQVPVPKESPDRLFIWLSPLAVCLGLGSAAALWRGRALDGVITVVIFMGGNLMLLSQIPRLCSTTNNVGVSAANRGLGGCAWWLATPLMTLGNPVNGYWALNRILWLAVGVGLVVGSLFLARREEVLFGRPEE